MSRRAGSIGFWPPRGDERAAEKAIGASAIEEAKLAERVGDVDLGRRRQRLAGAPARDGEARAGEHRRDRRRRAPDGAAR